MEDFRYLNLTDFRGNAEAGYDGIKGGVSAHLDSVDTASTGSLKSWKIQLDDLVSLILKLNNK